MVDAKDVRDGKGRGGGKKGKERKKHAEYEIALKNIIPHLKDELVQRETIRVRTKDIIREMGKEFEMKDPTTLLKNIKYEMFKKGIFLSTGRHKDGSDIYILRRVDLLDTLAENKEVKTEFVDGVVDD